LLPDALLATRKGWRLGYSANTSVQCSEWLCNAAGRLRRDPRRVVTDEHELVVANEKRDLEAQARAEEIGVRKPSRGCLVHLRHFASFGEPSELLRRRPAPKMLLDGIRLRSEVNQVEIVFLALPNARLSCRGRLQEH
jgi:hypothetical protein